MKKLDTSPIAPGIAFPIKGGTLAFLQLAHQEVFAAIMNGKIGNSYNTAFGYILFGCINTGSGTTYTISAGAVFFNGEVFLVDAATFTISGSNVAEGVIVTTQYTTDADGVKFTDGETRNVHNIRKIVFEPALSGSGAFDYNNAVNLQYKPQASIGQTVLWTMPGAGSQDSLLSTYFNTSTKLGIHPLTLDFEIDVAMAGNVVAGLKVSDANFGSLGATQGEFEYQIEASDLPELETDDVFDITPGGALPGYQTTNLANALGHITVNSGSPNNAISLMQPTVTALYIKRYK